MALALGLGIRRARSLPLNERYPVGGPPRPWTILGAAALLIVHLGFLCLGGSRAIGQAHALSTYVPVPATVSSASLRTWVTSGRHGNHTHYKPDISYRYEVDGKAYGSTAVDAADHDYSSAEARAALARYHVGAHITAYRDPGQPGNAFLIHTCRADPYLLVDVAILFDVLGLFLLVRGLPPADVFARSRRFGLILAYTIAIPILADLHYRMSGGTSDLQILFIDGCSGLFCIYPLCVWLRLRPWGLSPLGDAQALAAMEERPPLGG
jgi:hypothetical protein